MARYDVPTPLKVAILSSTFLPTIGGVQLELKWLLDSLDRRLDEFGDIDFHFIYPASDGCAEEYAQFRNVTTHRLPLRATNKLEIVAGIVKLGRLLTGIDPDVVHCYGGLLPDGLWAIIAARLFRLKYSVVVTSHGSDVAWLPHISYGMRESRKARALTKWVARRIDRHVQVSEAMIQYAAQAGTPRSIIRVIPNGIPLADEYNFESELPVPCDERTRGGVNSETKDGFTILSLSSGRRVKKVDALVEAFHMAKRDLGDSKLLLACVGSMAERIRRLVEQRGLNEHVRFIGEVTGPTKHEYFDRSDVYCLTSHFESLGITVLEAMRHETVVVATAVGGVTDIVEDGSNGLLVSPTDPKGIAAAIVNLYRNPSLRKKLVANGIESVKRYSMSRAIDAYLSLYCDLK